MKLMTINTHSLVEANYEEKLARFVDFVLREQPDLIAMQEVNQSAAAPVAGSELAEGFCPPAGADIPLRQDNHAAQAARLLRQGGLSCQWTWLPAKLGYGKYDEGMALFSLRRPIEAVDAFRISRCSAYDNWKTRWTLGVQIGGDWYYTVHMGWWADAEEPFEAQWRTLDERLRMKKENGRIWLLGDFNSPAEVRGQGYDCICGAGWQDTYRLAHEKDSGITVAGVIDGWREQLADPNTPLDGMRIDHIWCSEALPVVRSQVVLNGQTGPVVSDHFGVIITVEGENES